MKVSTGRTEMTSPAQKPAMAPRGDAKLFFCILFITCCFCCCFTVTRAEIATDCCLQVTNSTIPKSRVVGYRRQVSGQGCSIDAMILVTKLNRKPCVPADEPWVLEVVKHVKALQRHCKKQNNKGKVCKYFKGKQN